MANMDAPMAGKVLEILVKVGEAITEDDEVIILEAMKMENPIFAPEGGVVKEVKVNVGQQIAEGDVIIVLE